MTKEDLDAIEARLNVARTMNAIEEDDEDDCENNVSRYYEHYVSMLVAGVKRLTREHNATVADLYQSARGSLNRAVCEICSHLGSCSAYAEGHRPLHCSSFKWCGVREAAHG